MVDIDYERQQYDRSVIWFSDRRAHQRIPIMAVKLLSESMDATITDEDQIRIDRIISFWFREQSLTAPQIDRRMDIWFGDSKDFDKEITAEFAGDVEEASDGRLDHWAHKPAGRLVYAHRIVSKQILILVLYP